MAVTIITQPLGLVFNTISNGFEFTVTSDLITELNFRYTFQILVNGVDVGTKKVPSTGTNTTVNLEESIKAYIFQSTQLNGSDIWDITSIDSDPDNPSLEAVEIIIGDQYELNQVIIPSVLAGIVYALTRGFGSGIDYEYTSRFRPTNSDDQNILRVVRGQPMFTSYIPLGFDTNVIGTLTWTTYLKDGSQFATGVINFNIAVTGHGNYMVYFPVGTDHGMFAISSDIYRVTYLITTNMGGPQPVLVDTRIIDDCIPDPITLMWKNKYFQWSQFTFNGQNSDRLSKSRQQWESQIDGFRDVNVIGRSNLILNTSMLNDAESIELPDLFLSDEVYIIPSGERVVIDQGSLGIKTQQKDQNYPYSFRIKKSARTFRP